MFVKFFHKVNSPYDYIYFTNRWKELEDERFIVYDLKNKLKENLDSEEYKIPDEHPNTKAWDIIIENLLKDFPI